MFSVKKIVGAASFAAFTLFATSGAQALNISPSFVADFGSTTVSDTFFAVDFGDLDAGNFAFGPIVYNGSNNPNGRSLDTTDLATAQAASGPSFANAFTFESRNGSSFFHWSAQVIDSFPSSTVTQAGFLGFDVTFFDVSGLGSFGGGLAGFSQADLDAAIQLDVNVLTDGTTGDANFTGLDLPFVLGGVTPDSQILAVVSGKAFSNTATDPAYTIGVQAVPLPAPLVLLISALVGLGFLGRRRVSA